MSQVYFAELIRDPSSSQINADRFLSDKSAFDDVHQQEDEQVAQEAENLAAKSRADDIIAEAEDTCLKMRRSAEERAELILLTARHEAKKLKEQAVVEAMNEHRAFIGNDLENSEAEMTALISDCFSRIAKDLVPANVVVATVRAAIADMQSSRMFTLKVSGDDFDQVISELTDKNGRFPQPIAKVEVMGRLHPGKCYLESGNTRMMIDLETQLSAIRSTLAKPAEC